MGFRHPDYAASHGVACELPHSGGSVVMRAIDGSPRQDLASPYPLYACRSLKSIAQDFELLPDQAVSLTLRTSPFDAADVEDIKDDFDVVTPFKTHHIVDLDGPWRDHASRNAKRYDRIARANFSIEPVDAPTLHAESFRDLHAAMLARIGKASSPPALESIRAQLSVPGAMLFRAMREGEPCGYAFYMVDGEQAYAHLLAVTEKARAEAVIYGLYGVALDVLSDHGVRHVDFGGNPGAADAPDHPVSRFKAGWSSHVALSYILGKILDERTYADLSSGRRGTGFPAYRYG